MSKFIIKDEQKDCEELVKGLQKTAKYYYEGNQEMSKKEAEETPRWMSHNQAQFTNPNNENPFAIDSLNLPPVATYPYTSAYGLSAEFRRSLHAMESETDLLNIPNRFHSAQAKTKAREQEERRLFLIERIRNELSYSQPQPFPFENNPRLRLDCSDIPPELMEIAEALSRQYGFEVEAVIFTLLFFVVIAVHGRVFVKPNSAWTEAMEMFGMVVRGSGGRKTELVKVLKLVFDRFITRKTLEAKKDNCDKRVVKNLNSVQRMFSMQILNVEFGDVLYTALDDKDHEALYKKFESCKDQLSFMYKETDEYVPSEGHLPQIFFTNTTSKAFIKMLEEQGGYLACCNGENTFIRTSKLLTECSSYLLSVHDMEHIDDITKTAGSFSMNQPAVTILQMAQHNVALKFYADEDMKLIGLSPRFIPLFSSKDCRTTDDAPEKLMEVLERLYEPRINALLDRYFSQDKESEKFMLRLDDDAYRMAKNFETEMKRICSQGFAFMSSFLNKAHGQAIRFAAAIHAFNHAYEAIQDSEISEAEMRAGIAMMKMVLPHAEYVFNQSLLAAHIGAVAIIKALLRRSQGAEVFELTARELSQMTHLKKQEVEPALALLESYNLCALYREPGRATVVLLHPAFYHSFAEAEWYE